MRADPASSPELRDSDAPVLIEDDSSRSNSDGTHSPVNDLDSDLPTFTSLVLKQVRQAPSKMFSADDLALISKQLQVLSDCLSGIMVPPQPSPPPVSDPPVSDPVAPQLLSSLSQDKVVWLVHRPLSGLRSSTGLSV